MCPKTTQLDLCPFSFCFCYYNSTNKKYWTILSVFDFCCDGWRHV